MVDPTEPTAPSSTKKPSTPDSKPQTKSFGRKIQEVATKKLLPDSDYYKIFKFLKKGKEESFSGRNKDTLILWIAISLASLSGVPLPIIGVIFGYVTLYL